MWRPRERCSGSSTVDQPEACRKIRQVASFILGISQTFRSERFRHFAILGLEFHVCSLLRDADEVAEDITYQKYPLGWWISWSWVSELSMEQVDTGQVTLLGTWH
jgi:hypothetical protein